MNFKSEKPSFLYLIIIEVVLIVVSFYSGFFIRGLGIPKDTIEEFPLIQEAYDILQKNFVSDLPEKKEIQYQMLRGMADTYQDPYTIFVEPQQHELQSDQLKGKYGGIGCTLDIDSENHYILYPYPDSPAQEAGILDRDRLLAVEDLEINMDVSNEYIQAAIRGPVGEKVTLTIAREPDYEPFNVTIKREEVSLPSVTWNILQSEPEIGILHVHVIAATTEEEIENGIKNLQKSDVMYFILDLRDNSGGLVESAVATARLFLKEGIIIEQQYRDEPVESFKVEKEGQFSEIPLVTFINQNTASSAEILAGSLQTQNRSILIGSPSYGKDSIQLVFNLSDGSSLHVTSANWWLPDQPSGLSGSGLQPDIQLTSEYQSEENYEISAIEYFQSTYSMDE